MQGTLQLFRTQQQLDGTAADIAILRRYGVRFEVLDRAGCIRHEPALASVDEKFVGGMLLPGDETGDCFQFTQRLAALATDRGAAFRQGVTVRKLLSDGAQLTGVDTDAGILKADAYLVAMGSHSPLYLKDIGIRIPVYPVKGYSITVPITDPRGAPESTVMDETHKVAVTRLGDRIRAGGTAELAGYTLKLHDSRRRTLEHVVADLFPKGGDVSKAEFWCGLRPMTPDGTPVIGGTRLGKLFLATGHGTLGWTMAAGTGCVMADLISGRDPEIDMEGLTVERYRGAYGSAVRRAA
jgi:D-amino-acid dehydrogenase